MKAKNKIFKIAVFSLTLLGTSCEVLDNPQQNLVFVGDTNYTLTENMVQPLIGAYAEFQNRGWEQFPLIAVRGDDVNAGGLGDQPVRGDDVNAGGLGDQPQFGDTDRFTYTVDYWMYNSVWQGIYGDVLNMHSAMEEITKYKEFAPNPVLADQYIAEVKVLRGFLMLQLSRVWGNIFIPTTSDPSDFLVMPLSSKDDVMQHISDQMDEAIPLLANLRPNQRTDVTGGVPAYRCYRRRYPAYCFGGKSSGKS